GGRCDEGPPAGVLVLVRDRQHLRVDPGENPREHGRPQTLEVPNPGALERCRDPVAERVRVLVVGPPQAEHHVRPRVGDQLATRQQPRLERRAAELERRGPLHQGPIEIEERGPCAAPTFRAGAQPPFTSTITASPWPPP